MSDINAISQVLAQMQALKAGMRVAPPRPEPVAQAAAGNEFGQVLKASLQHVNKLQQESAAAIGAFERGEPGADLAQAMIAAQKSSIAFKAATEVRNRFVRAYQEIMNMPI